MRNILQKSGLEKDVEKPEFDAVMAPLQNSIRRRILMLLSSGKGCCLSSFQKHLNIKDHTKILFHIKMLRSSGLIEQGTGKAYLLTKKGEMAVECLQILRHYLKDE